MRFEGHPGRMSVCVALIAVAVANAASIAGEQGRAGGRTRMVDNAIIGRVIDSSGRPVSGVFVTLLWQREDFLGKHHLVPVGVGWASRRTNAASTVWTTCPLAPTT